MRYHAEPTSSTEPTTTPSSLPSNPPAVRTNSVTSLSSSGGTSSGNSGPIQTSTPMTSSFSSSKAVSSSTILTQSPSSSSRSASPSTLLNHSSSARSSTTTSNISTLIQTSLAPVSDLSASTQTAPLQSISSSAVTTQSLHRNGPQVGVIIAIVASVMTSILVVGVLLFRWRRRRIREGRFFRIAERLSDSREHIVTKSTVDASEDPQAVDADVDRETESPAFDGADANPFADPVSGGIADVLEVAPDEAVTSSGPQQTRDEQTLSVELRLLEAELQSLSRFEILRSPPPSYFSE
ncbi:hypothetical protein C8R45DRAFT_297448 [Mycena sanguinolenta]|nr:hypothetical protein C8R45DRAFT_297448 [Mycena sanguinolenta]